ARSATQVDLAWQSAGAVSGFRLERRAGGMGSWVQIAEVSGEARAYSDLFAPPIIEVSYRVKSYNSLGESPASTEATVFTAATQKVSLQALADEPREIRLTWQGPPGSSEYWIEQRNGKGDSWRQIAQVPGNLNQITDQGLTPGTEYDYRIFAVGSRAGEILA